MRIDDALPEDPRWEVVGAAGLALHVAALAYCNRNLTDGVVPRARAQRLLAISDVESVIAALIDEGWWTAAGADIEIADYLECQPDREKVLKVRADKKARQQRWLDKKNALRDASKRASRDASRDAAPVPVPVPDPKGGYGGTGFPRPPLGSAGEPRVDFEILDADALDESA